jgi:hypothetical protein
MSNTNKITLKFLDNPTKFLDNKTETYYIFQDIQTPESLYQIVSSVNPNSEDTNTNELKLKQLHVTESANINTKIFTPSFFSQKKTDQIMVYPCGLTKVCQKQTQSDAQPKFKATLQYLTKKNVVNGSDKQFIFKCIESNTMEQEFKEGELYLLLKRHSGSLTVDEVFNNMNMKKNLNNILIFRQFDTIEPVFSGVFKSPKDCITKNATDLPAEDCLIEMEKTGVYTTTLPHNNPTGGYKRLTHTKKNKKSKKTRRSKKNGKK